MGSSCDENRTDGSEWDKLRSGTMDIWVTTMVWVRNALRITRSVVSGDVVVRQASPADRARG